MSAPRPPLTPVRFTALDSLRGICACMVVLFHLPAGAGITGTDFVRHGFLFVDFFFVLSGFVIAASYGDKLAGGFSIPRFMGLRLGRIYPLHLAMLLVYLAFELTYATGRIGHAARPPFHAPNDMPSFFASLALVQSFLPLDSEGWNSPSWSIQVEIWTYLLYAGIFAHMRRALVPIALLLALIAAACVLHATDHYLNVVHQGALARCVYGFSLGVVACRFHRAQAIRLSGVAATAIEAIAVIATILLVTAAGAGPLSMVVPVFFAVVVLVFARQEGAVSRLLLRRLPHRLGVLSFSIYLIHMFLIERLANVVTVIAARGGDRFAAIGRLAAARLSGGSWLTDDLVALAVLALVVGCAAVTYRLVEQPGQRWSRRLILGEHPGRAAMRVEAEAPTF